MAHDHATAAIDPDLSTTTEARRTSPGKASMTQRMPASARAIARAVAAAMAPAPDADAHVDRALGGSGQPLPDGVRDRFERSLGVDLGGVRVHQGGAAATAAAAVGARAFAFGDDVVMGAGEYAPDSAEGIHLLAHEVAHTVQQRGSAAAPQYKLTTTTPGDAAEVEADRAAAAMVAGDPFAIGAAGTSVARIARWADDRGARAVLAAIERADLPAIRQLILALETARANNTPAVELGDRTMPVAIADLHELETRARARFTSLDRAAPGAQSRDGVPDASLDHGPAPASADHGPAPASAEGADGAPASHPPAAQGGAHGHGAGLQIRERFRQEFDLMAGGREFAGGWLILRSARIRIEVYDEQTPVASGNGERTQVAVPSATTRQVRAGRPAAPASVGGQVELPRFAPGEWHGAVDHVQARTNFAPSLSLAREGEVMTGNIGVGTVQVRGRPFTWGPETSFECPIRLIERARNGSSGAAEWRIAELRPTFHAGPVQLPGHDSFVRVSLELSLGPNLTRLRSWLTQRGVRAAADAVERRAEQAAATATENAAERTAASSAENAAERGAVNTAENAAERGAVNTAENAAERGAVNATENAAMRGGGEAALEGGARVGARGVAARGVAALGAVAEVLGFLDLPVQMTIWNLWMWHHAWESGQRDAALATRVQRDLFDCCMSYAQVMTGGAPRGGRPGADGAHAAEQRIARAVAAGYTRERIFEATRTYQFAGRYGLPAWYQQAYVEMAPRARAAAAQQQGFLDVVGAAIDAVDQGGYGYRAFGGW
ncbi:MAG: DUF4157 domain-containing protein [Myxococcales bacterium]|nr:DUF4157 domain-containing protein [Myxococcales bacterium]